MSGLAAIFHRDGSPVDQAALERMTAAIAHRGIDGISHWSSNAVGLGHCAHWLLPEDVGSSQPTAAQDGQLVLTFDGRIDNREDLQRLLEIPASAPDAAFVLAAYGKWGESCPEHLLGDFAFALWDERRQQTFCARDIMGVRPFLYFLSDRLFLAASERRPLFTHASPTRTPNEPFIAGLMMMRVISPSETIHRDVHRLPAATCMTVTRENVRLRRYWNFEGCGSAAGTPIEACAEKFSHLLTQAVRCRLRSAGHVGLLLSGGLDSTSIAVEAARQTENAGKGRLRSYSLSFPGWLKADETDLFRETIRLLNLDGVIQLPHSREVGGYEADVRRDLDFPEYFNESFFNGLRTVAVHDNCRVLLTGLGGDEWFSGSPYAIGENLRRGRLRVALRDSWTVAGDRNMTPLEAAWRFGIKPQAPAALGRLFRRFKPPRMAPAPWIDPDFAKRTCLVEHLRLDTVGSGLTRAQFQPLFLYESGALAHFSEAHDRCNARFGMETRHPLQDRRLVELGLSLTPAQCWEGGRKKRVLRAAARGKIPEVILHRSAKAEFSRQMCKELERNGAVALFERSALARRSWIRNDLFQRMLVETLAQSSQPDYRLDVRLWNVFALELMAQANVI